MLLHHTLPIGHALGGASRKQPAPCHTPSAVLHHTSSRQAGIFGPSKPAMLSGGLTQQPESRRGRQRTGTVCMAHPRRVARVASQIQREISNLFVTDQVLAGAICPERAMGSSEISALASVTDVYVSNDLQVVKVYVSIYSDPRGKKRAMDRLKKLEGYTRTQIGQRVVLRLTPEIRYEYDDSLDQAEMIQKVIGTQDVERFKRELEEEERLATGGQQEEGFFDEYEQQGPSDSVDEEEEDDEGPQVPGERRKKFVFGRTEDQMMKPGPFDDLFTGPADDDHLVGSPEDLSSRADLERRERNRAKRQRRQARKQAEGAAAGSAQ